MIVVKLQGGLGNQMFQFAAARALGSSVYLDLEFLTKKANASEDYTERTFDLSLFPNMQYKELSDSQRRFFLSRGFLRELHRLLLNGKVVVQKEMEEIRIPKIKNIYLAGYFQSESYFRKIRHEILELYRFPIIDSSNLIIKDQIVAAGNNSVSIHVRRGDYLKPQIANYHGVLPLSYYRNALEIMRKELGEMKVFVFSDDVFYVRNHFADLENVVIVSGNELEPWKDMFLMTCCANHIIANSSFSWWGAWLSTHMKGINIAPRDWFNAKVVNFQIDDIVPAKWIKI